MYESSKTSYNSHNELELANFATKEKTMPVITVRALEVVVSYLPRISADLKRIADALETIKAKESSHDT